ncbi:hypothetical protein P4475_02965 [Halalkalibacterium halodurans]|uniref:hypothetical protein n=1 Tax=Halalkalibacterium halodurans TaxID=86665 RepID=UPI001585E7B6|nr:hypothetical protein [Halalkalibacterium halodurans]MED3645797.1 hypothetical protein [Halalkalibacterium halodurans]MED4163261.1 hypothetical protein [Halalkalibacterium halodurans]
MILHTYVTGEGDPFVFLHSGGMTGATEYEEQRDFFIKRSGHSPRFAWSREVSRDD